jgi:glyoxylase-like metal-dependent hydrolase (beta-lactamase superfamily II)
MALKSFPKVKHIFPVIIPFPGYPELMTCNVYALGNSSLTLIDSGPKFPGAFELVQKQLKVFGFDVTDITRIIITHGHVDHFGLAMSICKAAGHPVDCFIHSEEKWRISSDNLQKKMWDEEMENLMIMVGMPQKESQSIKERLSFFTGLCDPLDKLSTVVDGERFDGDGYHLTILHTPGHTSGAICLYEYSNKILFSGDTILKHITPNPFIEIKRHHLSNPNYRSIEAYLNSLEKLSALDIRFVFPGHGEYIENLFDIIVAYKMHRQERTELVWKALKKRMLPIYYLISDLFPEVPENDIFLAISEILAHIEILIKEGRAEIADIGPPKLYRAL